VLQSLSDIHPTLRPQHFYIEKLLILSLQAGRRGGITYLLFFDETKQSIIGIPAYPMTETMRYRYDESSPLEKSDYVDIYTKKEKYIKNDIFKYNIWKWKWNLNPRKMQTHSMNDGRELCSGGFNGGSGGSGVEF